jgi:ribosome-binding protein aMBF1 (putative translation factor)
VTTLSKVESGTMKPTDDLVSKLEKSLNIIMIEKVPLVKPEGKTSRSGSSLTLGDLIKKK